MSKKIVSLILIFCLLLNNFIIPHVMADNVNPMGADNIYVYDFKKPIDSKVEDVGWEIVDYHLTGPSYPNGLPYRNSSYGIQVGSKNVGEYIQFNLMVQETGYYDIEFMGGNYGGGGIATIYFDSQDIGTYDFYSAEGIASGRVEKCNSLILNEGIHKLTVKLKSPNEHSKGRNMYPGELKLEKAEIIPPLTKINVTALNNELKAGQESRLSVKGYDAEEKEYSLDAYTREFTSDNPSVVLVESDGTIRAVGEGSAEIVVSVDLDGTLLKDSITLKVSGSIDHIKYDFKNGIDSALDKVGWEIVESNSSGGYRNQSYGIQVQSGKDEYIKIAFDVPVDGYYTVKFVGAGAGGGAIADLLIDDSFIGQFDFYSKDHIPAKDQVIYKTLELTRGIHYFILKAVDKSESWGYNMYPSELELERKEDLPSIESIDLECDKEEIAVGQSARLTVKAIMDDGYIDHLRGTDATVEFLSSNPSVVVVDEEELIRGVAPGEASVSAKVTLNGETKVGNISIDVNNKRLSEVVAKLEGEDLFVGGSNNIIVEAKLDDGSLVDNRDLKLQFTSEDESIIVVDENGVVTGIGEGSATIEVKATLGGTSVSEEVEVSVNPVSLKSIDVDVDKEKLFIGRNAKVLVTGMLSNGEESNLEGATIEYVSSNKEVLDVDQDGVITAKGVGAAKIGVKVTMDNVELTGDTPLITVEDTSNIKNSKTRRTYYTDEKIQAARENISKYDWAKATRDGAVVEADRYVEDLEFLWSIVPGQSIPRSFEVNDKYICPSCKTDLMSEFSKYPWLIDVKKNPWKIKCPKCSMLFPTNDFEAYYESGMDEHGIFNPSLADRSLLKNELYPDKGEGWGVDDGYGFIDENGKKHTFIAYYAHLGLWHGGIISKALNSLKQAYVYTGDIKYARAGIVLLDRIADVYPSMNLDDYKPEEGFKNADGGTGGKGNILGSIWEAFLVQSFIEAYDAFFDAIDDKEVIQFLSDKSHIYDLENPKNTSNLIRKNIEDGILREVYPSVKDSRIRGNFGMHQAALALAAVVLDSQPETSEWLDFTFQSGGFEHNPYRVTGGDVLPTLIENVDRDGHGDEAAPEYNKLWLDQLRIVADVLEDYDGYKGANLYENLKFKRMFSSMYPLMLCEKYTAQIGDSGETGNLGLALDLEHTVKAFEKYGDPILGQLAYFLNNNSTKGLRGDIFSKNPEGIAEKIDKIISKEGTLDLKSDNLTGYGFAALRDGSNKKHFDGYRINFPDMEIVEDTAGNKYFANSGTIQFEAQDIGQCLSFKFNVEKADTYEINIKPFKAASYGIYDVYLDGEKISTIDFYGGSGANSELEALTTMHVSEGEHEITFKGIGKNDKATNYKMGIMYLMFFDEEAKEVKNDASNIDTQRDLWMYYGRTIGHGHRDSLNVGVHAYGIDIAPDLGSPEVKNLNAKRLEWESHTISHNTVLVDRTRQQGTYTGYPLHFDDSGMVKLIDVDAPNSYNSTDMYRRTLAMIKVNDEISYGVDFFRVSGGSDHRYSFHGAEGDVTTEGLSLVEQGDGTYAGTDIEFGKRPDYESLVGWEYDGAGFHWLTNVKKDSEPDQKFSVDWKIKDTRQVLPDPMDIHLRLTMLGDFDEVALADGQPPRKPGNPKWLTYMIAKRQGEDLKSTFTSVIEPYKDERYIEDIEEVPVTVDGKPADEDVKAVKVTLKDSRVDYIISALDKEVLYTVDDKFTFQGFFGVYSERDGKPIYSYINDGTEIGQASEKKANIDGTVVDFTKDLSIENQITIETDSEIKAEDMVGRYIYIENDGVRNAVYKILGVKSQKGNRIVLDLGDTTLIRSFVDVNDFDKGYIYDVKEGAGFTIPLSHIVKYDSDEPEDPELPDSVKKVIKLIEDLPELENLKLSDKGRVEAARKAYDKLEDDDKTLVENIEVLKAAEERIAELEKEQEEEPKLPKPVKKVIKLIEDLPELENLKLSDRGKVEAARKAYDKLEDDDKALVENIEVLKAAEERIAELEKVLKDSQLPKTGESGNLYWYLGGVLLIVIGILFGVRRKREK